ncbi:WUSCHEL-related homeobox 8-like isoform X2 [Phragmites australis]|uniref:WUSCHEL-related homeobox 8-like isoform X2 n=1 Tax=Phragmites australis TaxID=29695 RepID=UPI002D78A327|nr:WUSCHEL-related homeobox 8-like isoform X2 [Phragmites australis]
MLRCKISLYTHSVCSINYFPFQWELYIPASNLIQNAGMRFSNLYCDPLIVPGGHKITARQRWQPTPMQLQILESIFDQGNGTPSKQRIKEITAELSHHGQISETNVYNWFQNRRARSKRKQAASLPNNAESEAEVDEESLTDKKPKSDRPLHQSKAISGHDADGISEMHHFDTEHDQIGGMMYGSNGNGLRSSGSSGQMPFYENIMSNPRIDQHFPGKVESSRSFSHLQHGEGFDMFG